MREKFGDVPFIVEIHKSSPLHYATSSFWEVDSLTILSLLRA
jgi:hypothetical protein